MDSSQDPTAEAPATAPLARLQAVAASAVPEDITAFRPTSEHFAVAGALFEADEPPTSLSQLATMAGITAHRLKEIYTNPAACSWILGRAADIARFGLAAVYARNLRMALTSRNPSWVRLFYERFDPEYRKLAGAGATNNVVIDFSGWTTEELTAFVQQKRRLKFGETQAAS